MARASGSPAKAKADHNGGPAGDLYVFITVKPHPRFNRHEYDIHSEETISVTRAVLGGEVAVDTIDGQETLRVGAGTQPNQVFRLRAKGVQFLDGNGRGDHYVHVNVRIPSSLSDEQKQLFEQLANMEGESAENRGVFDKVKEFFSA